MSEHDEIVKRLSKWLPALVLQEVAQVIRQLERERDALAVAVGSDDMVTWCVDVHQQLAEARAEIERWKGIAEGATADLRRYARDEMPERRRISAELYEKQIKEALATPAPKPEGFIFEGCTFESTPGPYTVTIDGPDPEPSTGKAVERKCKRCHQVFIYFGSPHFGAKQKVCKICGGGLWPAAQKQEQER